jgi:hypothetical protein
VLSDRLSSRQVLRHLEMVAQGRKHHVRPFLQFRMIASLGVALEQRNGVLVTADLIAVVTGAEVSAL